MATTREATIVSIFDSVAEAQSAIEDLVTAGIRREDISMVAHDRNAAGTTDPASGRKSTDGTTVGENIAGGTLVGGVGGLLIGLAALAIPGLGPVLAAGPLAAPLAATLGGALTGAVGGGLIGALKESGVPSEDAEFYAEHVRRGGVLVTVRADADLHDRAEDILHRHGAVDVDERSQEFRSAGWSGAPLSGTAPQSFATESPRPASPAPRSRSKKTSDVDTTAPNANAIPVVEEQLEVGKRAVQRGGVRVYSHVVDQPVEKQVNLREEHARVERRPVNRPANPGELEGLRDQTIEVRETIEEPVISKQARVVEEVTIGKDSTERTETVRDTVRHTEVDVQQLGGAEARNFTDDFRRDFQTRYANMPNARYETFAPAYDYGSRMAGDARYSGRSFADVEDTLKTDYLRNNPNSTWDQTKGAVRYGWERMTGQRGADPSGVTHGTRNMGSDWDTDWRNHYQANYSKSGAYDVYRPAYDYGSRMAGDTRYSGRSFDDVEDTLRTDYLRNNPNSTWDNVKGAVRYGWEKVTGKRP